MVTARQVTTLMTGVPSVVLAQWLSSIASPVNHAFRLTSNNMSLSAPAFANTPPKAKSAFRYVPPKRGIPKNTQATGSRGCTQPEQSLHASLTLLVPKDHDGLTTLSYPTFFWHVSAPVPMAFALTERGAVQPLWEQQIQPQISGIVQLEMPRNLPELVPGKEYRWSVTLLCNSERPSANPFIQTWIQRVPATPALTQKLTAVTSNRDRASIYAQAGLWYDTLSAISSAHTVNPNDPFITEERLLLLDQVGLNQVTAHERRRLASQ